MRFRWTPRESSPEACDANTQVFVCAEFNRFDPIYMGPLAAGRFELPLMAPQEKFHYFYLKDDQKAVAEDQNRYLREKYIIDVIGKQNGKDLNLAIINFDEESRRPRIFNNLYEPQISALPRTLPTLDAEEKKAFPKVWRIPISIFNQYSIYSEEFFVKCFQFDFSHSKVASLAKEPLDGLAAFLEKHYKFIFFLYKSYSAIQPCGHIWALQQNSFLKFVQDVRL